ncbi:hypothetical protein, partial [Motilimonas pumila]|uniref:hypothetical protein n=1 Tax=Motilimonas pumila TaxID=2303987 RepID=UPI001E291F63
WSNRALVCTKEDMGDSLLGPFSLKCTAEGRNGKNRIYHDEIIEKTINVDFYVDGDNWDKNDSMTN